jgi:thiamine biosynthesis protein ThiI
MKGLLLLSAGIDSPVAGYLMLNQNIDIIALHLHNSPAENSFSIELSKRIVAHLSKHTGRTIPLYSAENHANEKAIWENANRRYQCLICKRLMYRLAERLAKLNGCDFIVTGENLGQVASQTLDNMVVLSDSITIPILRPLLCNDKNDTIRIAEEIGTYNLSKEQSIKKCPFVPNSPATKAKLEEIQYQESRLNIPQMVEDTLKSLTLCPVTKT